MAVADKKTGANKAWKNLFTVSSNTWSAAVAENYVGTKNILAETYQVTSLDSAGVSRDVDAYARPTTCLYCIASRRIALQFVSWLIDDFDV